MKRFRDLQFNEIPYKSGAYNATLNLGNYIISVGYGKGLYGSGPSYDTYEVLVVDAETDIPIPLSVDNDVLGWQHKHEIDNLMVSLQREPGFGEACRIFKRTQHNKCFIRISNMRDEAFGS